MQSSILAETQAFITRQRDALLAQREAIFSQQAELQKQLDEVNGMLAKFDVFLRDRKTARTKRVSVGAHGAQGNHDTFDAMISPTGRFVGFDSTATNLVGGDTNNSSDVFVRGPLR